MRPGPGPLRRQHLASARSVSPLRGPTARGSRRSGACPKLAPWACPSAPGRRRRPVRPRGRRRFSARISGSVARVAKRDDWLHVDFEDGVDVNFSACGFTPTDAGPFRSKKSEPRLLPSTRTAAWADVRGEAVSVVEPHARAGLTPGQPCVLMWSQDRSQVLRSHRQTSTTFLTMPEARMSSRGRKGGPP